MTHEEFMEKTALKVLKKLSREDKDFILKNPEPYIHHFGLGLLIRNKYIHTKKLDFICLSPDDISSEIVEKIISLLKGENDQSYKK